MPKAKTIDRVEYTKRRIIGRTDNEILVTETPITRVDVEIVFDKEHLEGISATDCGTGTNEGPEARTFTEEEMGRLTRHGMETCPVCGAKNHP